MWADSHVIRGGSPCSFSESDDDPHVIRGGRPCSLSESDGISARIASASSLVALYILRCHTTSTSNSACPTAKEGENDEAARERCGFTNKSENKGLWYGRAGRVQAGWGGVELGVWGGRLREGREEDWSRARAFTPSFLVTHFLFDHTVPLSRALDSPSLLRCVRVEKVVNAHDTWQT